MNVADLQKQTGLSEAAVLSALDSIMKELKKNEAKERKSIPKEHGDVAIYLTINKRYICEHCGTQYVKQISLAQKESITCIDKRGRVQTIYAMKKKAEPVSIDCYTKVCNNCMRSIQRMDRELLEKKYMELLTIIQDHRIEIRREL